MAKRNFYVKEKEFDDFQRKVINKLTDNSFIVKGCAGSGKSIMALWKAKDIQNRALGSYLFIVFTNALKQYMLDGIREVGIDDKKVDNLWHWNYIGCPSADYIIVDEAQDFSEEDILKFKSKAKKALLLYGDSAQQLYKFIADKTTVSMEQIAVITGFPTEQLVFNYRLPKKIARVAQHFNSAHDELMMRCENNEEGEKPKILQYRSLNEQLDAIAEIIENRSFEDVGILFRHNNSVETAYNYLRGKGLNIEAKYNQTMNLNFNSDNPKILTYHSAKGLQFEAVFIPECTCSDEDDRNPLYVAMTRTYQSLYIMHSGDLSSFFDPVPTDLYETI